MSALLKSVGNNIWTNQDKCIDISGVKTDAYWYLIYLNRPQFNIMDNTSHLEKQPYIEAVSVTVTTESSDVHVASFWKHRLEALVAVVLLLLAVGFIFVHDFQNRPTFTTTQQITRLSLYMSIISFSFPMKLLPFGRWSKWRIAHQTISSLLGSCQTPRGRGRIPRNQRVVPSLVQI